MINNQLWARETVINLIDYHYSKTDPTESKSTVHFESSKPIPLQTEDQMSVN